MSAARTERLLNLLGLLLNAKRPMSLRAICALEEFSAYRSHDPKTGERAFERDKAALVALGVPLRWIAPEASDDEAGGYRIDTQHYYLAQVNLTAQERALLSIAGAAAATLEGYSGHQAVRRAVAKLGFDADAAADAEAGGVRRHSALAHAPLAVGTDVARLAQHLDVLHQALVGRRQVDVAYPGGAPDDGAACTVRRLDPYGLFYRQGAWYLVGYCHLRRARRTFHMGRVSRIVLHAKRHAFVYPADFDIQKAARMRPWQYPKAAPQRVWVRLAERIVPAIAEIFGADIQVQKDAYGPFVCVEVSHAEGFLATILPLGDAAEVVAPGSMRALVADTYSALLTRYTRLAAGP